MSNDPVGLLQERVHALIQAAIDNGQPMKLIRAQLATMGVRWNYSGRHQGKRERARRLRQSARRAGLL